MKTKPWIAISLLLLASVLLTGVVVVSAMSSPNFILDWYVNLSGAGGGGSSSPQYTANFTIGQNVASAASSSNYDAVMGYWGAFPFGTYVYLPMNMKNP